MQSRGAGNQELYKKLIQSLEQEKEALKKENIWLRDIVSTKI